jgi:hypothetical protein
LTKDITLDYLAPPATLEAEFAGARSKKESLWFERGRRAENRKGGSHSLSPLESA